MTQIMSEAQPPRPVRVLSPWSPSTRGSHAHVPPWCRLTPTRSMDLPAARKCLLLLAVTATTEPVIGLASCPNAAPVLP